MLQTSSAPLAAAGRGSKTRPGWPTGRLAGGQAGSKLLPLAPRSISPSHWRARRLALAATTPLASWACVIIITSIGMEKIWTDGWAAPVAGRRVALSVRVVPAGWPQLGRVGAFCLAARCAIGRPSEAPGSPARVAAAAAPLGPPPYNERPRPPSASAQRVARKPASQPARRAKTGRAEPTTGARGARLAAGAAARGASARRAARAAQVQAASEEQPAARLAGGQAAQISARELDHISSYLDSAHLPPSLDGARVNANVVVVVVVPICRPLISRPNSPSAGA